MLQRLGIVLEIEPLVAKVRENHFDHERLKPKSLMLLLDFLCPELYQPHHLCEVLFLCALAFAGEFEMSRNSGFQEGTVILADEVAVPMWVVVIENWHNINIKARTTE